MMKKFLCLLLSLTMVLSFVGCKKENPVDPTPTPTYIDIENAELKALLEQWFKEDIGGDYLTLHFTLIDPSAYGIEKPELTLGNVESTEEELQKYANRLEELQKIDAFSLNDYDRLNFETTYSYFVMQNEYCQLEYDCSFAFTPNSGINNNLITNFTEFDIRSKEDAEDLIVLVNDTGRLIDDCIEYTLKQAEDGIMQSQAAMDSIIKQCERFISNVENNEIIKAYSAQLDKLGYDNAAELKEKMSDAVINNVIPAYQRIIDMYKNDLYDKTTASGALCELKGGKEYYEALFATKSSSLRSIAELEAELETAVNNAYSDYISVYRSMSDADIAAWDKNAEYGYSDSYEIMEHIKSLMSEDFPEIPNVNYSINYLDESVTSDNVVAYYLLVPVDDISKNVIKVNPSYCQDDPNYLCITLSHEGYPGHLYQRTYYYMNTGNIYREITSFVGWAEGWANYVECWAYEQFESNSKVAKINALDNELGYCLYSLVGILINYEGYDLDDVTNYLKNFYSDLSAKRVAKSMWNTLTGDPAMFMPYACMYKMLDLKKYAEDALGDKFNLKEFNTVILTTGETTYEILQGEVEKYIEANK